MARPRHCLNCGKDISHRGTRAKTCSPACRKEWSRNHQAAAALPDDLVHEVNKNGPRSLVKRAVELEVRELVKPVVREALTEDVLTALQDLVRLTPDAVATLQSDMQGDDAVLAQKAATTVLRYTVGHQALVTPKEAAAPQLVVNFGLPRPDDIPVDDDPSDDDPSDDAVVEFFECDVCHTELPTSERVANADRCQDCHDKRKHAILDQYGLV
jgi:predicted nucleic acid-binding Zn ribbon protein